jgi:ribosomal protein S5
MLKPNAPGMGIIAGGAVRKLLMISGLKDVTAKIHGAPNNINNVKAALKALAKIKPKSLYSSFSQAKTQISEVVPTAPEAAPKKAPKKA